MVNAGATVVDADVIVDGNIITCSYYAYVGKFMRAVFDTVRLTASAPAVVGAGA